MCVCVCVCFVVCRCEERVGAYRMTDLIEATEQPDPLRWERGRASGRHRFLSGTCRFLLTHLSKMCQARLRSITPPPRAFTLGYIRLIQLRVRRMYRHLSANYMGCWLSFRYLRMPPLSTHDPHTLAHTYDIAFGPLRKKQNLPLPRLPYATYMVDVRSSLRVSVDQLMPPG